MLEFTQQISIQYSLYYNTFYSYESVTVHIRSSKLQAKQAKQAKQKEETISLAHMSPNWILLDICETVADQNISFQLDFYMNMYNYVSLFLYIPITYTNK